MDMNHLSIELMTAAALTIILIGGAIIDWLMPCAKAERKHTARIEEIKLKAANLREWRAQYHLTLALSFVHYRSAIYHNRHFTRLAFRALNRARAMRLKVQ